MADYDYDVVYLGTGHGTFDGVIPLAKRGKRIAVIEDGYKKEFLSTGSSNGHITFHSVDEVLAWLRGSGDVEYIGWSTEMPIDHQWRPVVD
ncbi:hypothetical protein H7R52_06125 [Weissella confusa]|uniref:Uncharacterized protein n=1 Tax=Weissella confusa TaxID=1583 RepID=A0A923NDC5_WEICO|nr:hypothetical protein [Weissella confusa]